MSKSIEHLPKEYQAVAEFLVPYGYTAFKVIPNQGLCCLHKFAFTMGIIVGINNQNFYHGRYCFPELNEAVKAYLIWDGEGDPSGNWIKYKGTGGERENPNYKK